MKRLDIDVFSLQNETIPVGHSQPDIVPRSVDLFWFLDITELRRNFRTLCLTTSCSMQIAWPLCSDTSRRFTEHLVKLRTCNNQSRWKIEASWSLQRNFVAGLRTKGIICIDSSNTAISASATSPSSIGRCSIPGKAMWFWSINRLVDMESYNLPTFYQPKSENVRPF